MTLFSILITIAGDLLDSVVDRFLIWIHFPENELVSLRFFVGLSMPWDNYRPRLAPTFLINSNGGHIPIKQKFSFIPELRSALFSEKWSVIMYI